MNNEYVEVSKSGMSKAVPPDPCIVVIFGVTGDLTHRELIPSLYALGCKNLMPRPFAIIGFARRDWDDEFFRTEMKNTMKKVTECGEKEWEHFANKLFYVKGDFKDDPAGSYQSFIIR